MIFRALVVTKPSRDGETQANDVIFIFRGEVGHVLAFDMLQATIQSEKMQKQTKLCDHLKDCVSKLTDFFFNRMLKGLGQKEVN